MITHFKCKNPIFRDCYTFQDLRQTLTFFKLSKTLKTEKYIIIRRVYNLDNYVTAL